MSQQSLCIGVITAAHGIKGAVEIKPFTSSTDAFCQFTTVYSEHGEECFAVKVTGHKKSTLIATIAGVNDRNSAEKLKNTKLYIKRDMLPPLEEEEFYHADLIGMEVVEASGTVFGKVVAVHNFGAGDLVEIERIGGKEKNFYPFTYDIFPHIEQEAHRITIIPPAIINTTS